MEILFVISRILLGGFFIVSGIMHFTNLASFSGYAQSKGVPMPQVAVAVSGAMILLGGLSILLGLWVPVGVALLIIFLVPTTFKMHGFWADTDPMMRANNKAHFLKNVGLAGGSLAYLAVPGPWLYGLGM